MVDDVNYGPLAELIGTWEGDNGMDISPEPNGSEDSPYAETIVYDAGGSLKNAKTQTIAIVPYLQIVKRKSNGEIFHHQSGYLLYDAAEDLVMQSLVIPRGVCLLAGGTGKVSGDTTIIEVNSTAGKLDWGILQSPFMEKNAKTTAFTNRIEVKGDVMTYKESTMLDIYGKTFDHGDSNVLKRIN